MIELTPSTESLGLPIPAPWLLGLKVFGFLLHMVFMNLWLAGMPTALLLLKFKPPVAERLFKAMPFFMAFGINAGIVPLLFLQTLYPQFYYPATILQAWFWFLVIPLLIVAYYGVYLAAYDRYRIAAASIASLLLVWVGLTFSAAMSLTAAPEAWPAIFAATADAASVHGLHLNMRSETLVRFLLMLGMACGTLGAFFALDAEFVAAQAEYRREARRLVAPLYCVGLFLFGSVASLYGFTVKDRLPTLLWLLTAASMPAGAILCLVYWNSPTKSRAGMLLAVHFIVLLFNGLARQNVQTRTLERWSKLKEMPIRGDWDSFALFVCFMVIVLVILAWLARVAIRAMRPSLTTKNS